MNSNEKFKLFIIGCFSFFVSLFLIWALVFGGPIPFLQVHEFSSSDSIPTFGESKKGENSLDDHWEGGHLANDPLAEKLRSEVISSYDLYKSNPCNHEYKEAFIEVAVDFTDDEMKRMTDLRQKLDEQARDTIINSVAEGLLNKDDLPSRMEIYIYAGTEAAGGSENIYKACNED